MIIPVVTVLLAGLVEVGPGRCQVDLLINEPNKETYIVTETDRCFVIEQSMIYLK